MRDSSLVNHLGNNGQILDFLNQRSEQESNAELVQGKGFVEQVWQGAVADRCKPFHNSL